MPLEALYQNLILDHYKNPRNYGKLEGEAVRMRHENPSCGDHIELYLKLDEFGNIQTRFEGWGCALSLASASMMTAAINERSRTHAEEVLNAFRALFLAPQAHAESLGELKAFAGVREFPARMACALLPWGALAESLNRSH